MRLLFLVSFAWLVSLHSANAYCIDWISVDHGLQVEVTMRSVYQSKTSTNKLRMKLINNKFAFRSIERSKNEEPGVEYVREEQSLLNIFVDKVDTYFQKNGKKTFISSSQTYNFHKSFEEISDKFLRKSNFEFESDLTSSGQNGFGKIITTRYKFKYEIKFEPDSRVLVSDCNYDVFVFELIETLIDTDQENLKQHLGKPRSSRYFYTNRLMYPLRQQGRKNGEWVDYRTVTSARIVR